jgi:hypothetical protein
VERQLGDGAARYHHDCYYLTAEVEDLIAVFCQLGKHCDDVFVLPDRPPPDAGVRCAARRSDWSNVKLMSDQVFTVEMHDERTDIATDVEHYRATCRRVLPRRPMRMTVRVFVLARCYDMRSHDSGWTSNPLTGTPQ